MKTLLRSSKNRVIGGVCGGIAEYFGLDPVLIRLLFVCLAVFGGAGIIIYFFAWIIMPEKISRDNIQDAEFYEEPKKKTDETLKQNLKDVANEVNKAFEEVGNEFKKVGKDFEDKYSKERKSGAAWFGIFLVFLGAAFLLKTLGLLHFSWCGIWHYWPVFLIVLGVSVIPMKRWIKNTLWCLFLVFLLAAMLCGSHSRRCGDWHHSFHSHRSVSVSSGNRFDLEASRNGEHARLTVSAGACELAIAKPSEEPYLCNLLLNGEQTFSADFHESGENPVKFSMASADTLNNINDLRMDLMLNALPIWDLEFNVGAADINLDLSAFKINQLEMNCGATDVDLTLGNLHGQTKISISTGASDITIRVPKNADCQVITDSFLMNKELDGFVKSKNTYRTENHGSAAQSITIELDGAVGNFEIVRY